MLKWLYKKFWIVIFFIFLEILYKFFGIGAINTALSFMPGPFTDKILRKFGGQLGVGVKLMSKVYVDNTVSNDYSNLQIGSNCYIGKSVFFDLVEPIVIEDFCAISAQVMFITHSDVGHGPLKEYYPRKTGSIRVGRGSWIGVRAIILPGITIGECAAIGAGAVVTCDIPSYSVAVGVPAKVIKSFKMD